MMNCVLCAVTTNMLFNMYMNFRLQSFDAKTFAAHLHVCIVMSEVIYVHMSVLTFPEVNNAT
jgi:hypothetical protein